MTLEVLVHSNVGNITLDKEDLFHLPSPPKHPPPEICVEEYNQDRPKSLPNALPLPSIPPPPIPIENKVAHPVNQGRRRKRRISVSDENDDFLVHLASLSSYKLNKELTHVKSASFRKLVLIQNILFTIHNQFQRERELDLQHQESDLTVQENDNFFIFSKANDDDEEDEDGEEDERYGDYEMEDNLVVDNDVKLYESDNNRNLIDQQILKMEQMQLELETELKTCVEGSIKEMQIQNVQQENRYKNHNVPIAILKPITPIVSVPPRKESLTRSLKLAKKKEEDNYTTTSFHGLPTPTSPVQNKPFEGIEANSQANSSALLEEILQEFDLNWDISL